MPGQESGVGPLFNHDRRTDLASVQGVVVPSVLVLLLDAAADLEVKIGCHRDIAGIKQAMESKLLAGGTDIISRRDEQQRFLEQQRQEMIEQRVSST